jgi:Na+/H+ antiporter NhaD/arsenite permease-like protein
LLIKCGVVLTLVFTAFVLHSVLHIEASVVALLGAGVLVLITRLQARDYMVAVEWETLLFFAGLFLMVGALVKSGVIDRLAELVTTATGGEPLATAMLLLWVSALLSGIIDNIPYVATMSPVVAELVNANGGGDSAQVLWWSLALGADLGGNATAVGASANVVILGLAERDGRRISFWEFTKYGLIVAVVTIALCTPYLWLRYFVLA